MVGIRSIGWDDGDDWRRILKHAKVGRDEVKASTTIVPVVTLGEKIEMDVDTRAMANRDMAGRLIIVVGDWYLAWAIADYGQWRISLA